MLTRKWSLHETKGMNERIRLTIAAATSIIIQGELDPNSFAILFLISVSDEKYSIDFHFEEFQFRTVAR